MAEQATGIGTGDYPAYRFHPTLPHCLVQTAAEDAALGEGWRDHPYTEDEQAALALGDESPPGRRK